MTDVGVGQVVQRRRGFLALILDFGFWILILILDFDLVGFCSTEVGGVTEKLDGGGGRWLTEEEK